MARPKLNQGATFKSKRRISPQMIAARDKTNASRKGTNLNATTRTALLSLEEQDRDSLPDRPKHSGRIPLFLQKPDLLNRFIDLIEDGHYYNTACSMVGWSYDTVMQWLDKGARGQDKHYYDFWALVKKAESTAEVSLHHKMSLHHDDSWQSIAWVMERRFPDRWGRREALNPTVIINNNNQIVNVKDELATQVIEHTGARDLARDILSGGPSPDDSGPRLRNAGRPSEISDEE